MVTTSAQAFDTHNSPDDKINTCFTDHWRWETANRRSEMTAAVTSWEDQVPQLEIDHDSYGSPCGSAKVELDWVNSLDGGLGVASWSLSGPDYIRFAGDINWSWNDNPVSNEYDFRSTAIHELGHALGLKHPEYDAAFPPKSWDGFQPTMKAEGAQPGTIARRTLKQDDIAGGHWAEGRQWVPRPSMNSTESWESVGASIWSCLSGVVCLGADGASIFTTIRFTVDSRGSRSTPEIRVNWEPVDGNGLIRVRLMGRGVNANGTVGSWQTDYGLNCFNNSSSWVNCTDDFAVNAHDVMDLRVAIYNHSGSTIRINTVKATDG